jgi:hypothetical protein
MSKENTRNDILTLLEGLQARGLNLRVDGEQLLVWPRDKLTEADRGAIRTHKRAMIDFLRPPPQNHRNTKNYRTTAGTEADKPVPDIDPTLQSSQQNGTNGSNGTTAPGTDGETALGTDADRPVPDDPDLAGVDEVVDLFRQRYPLESAQPPPGARLYFGDKNGLACDRDLADHWTWEGGPTWFKVADYPIPFCEMLRARQHHTWEGFTTAFKMR